MRRQTLLRIEIPASLQSEEALTDLLSDVLETTATSFHHFDSGRVTIIAFIEDASHWSAERRARLEEGRRRLRACGLEVPEGVISAKRVRREDWAESWKEHFPPIQIGSALLVEPTWSNLRPVAGQQVVVLDPGLSFGTGHHATTEYCLRELVKARPRGLPKSLLDLGCGSGILAISAAKLGFAPIRALDYDPDAVRIARENAESNRVPEMAIARGDVTKLSVRPRKRYDVVCANLLGDLLIKECRRIAATVAPEGQLVLAGILKAEFDHVVHAYAGLGWKLIASHRKKEWRSGTFISPPAPATQRVSVAGFGRPFGRVAPRP